jgi:NTF2 fold immunity protein
MITKISLSIILLAVLLLGNKKPINENVQFSESFAYVPNEATAVSVGVAILLPIYGKEVKQYKYKAMLIDSNTWFVYGTLKGKLMLGGVPSIKIQKSSCKVIAVDKGK